MTEIPPASTLDAALEWFPYQRELIAYLKSEERDLWSWFASARYLARYAESIRHELLKATYRFDRAEHAKIYARAQAACDVLGVDAPVTIYQATNTDQLNAALAFVPGEVHIILHGAVTSLLTDEELQAALAHELTHYVLWSRFDRELLIAHRLLDGIASHPNAAASHIESASLFALYLEIHADRGALVVMQEPMAAIRSLIKVQTGLADIHAESYLRQADEIFARERVKSQQLTHPESFIRARALREWSLRGRDAFAEIARMIEGTDAIDALDLVGQVRLSNLTRRLLSAFLAPRWMQTDAVLAHARRFFPDLQPSGVIDEDFAHTIAALDPSVQRYLAYVLLDFVVADPELEDVPIAAVIETATRCGMGEQMLALMVKELALPKKRLAKLEEQRAQMLAAAERQAEAGR
jgi:hypothetical protein